MSDEDLKARVARATELRPSAPSSPLLAPLRSLAAFYPAANTAEDRAALGVHLERRSLELHRNFLASWGY
jgi:hypothetical protein